MKLKLRMGSIILLVVLLTLCKGENIKMEENSKTIIEILLYPPLPPAENIYLIRLKENGNYYVAYGKKKQEDFFKAYKSKNTILDQNDLKDIKNTVLLIQNTDGPKKEVFIDRCVVIVKIENNLFNFYLGHSNIPYLDDLVYKLIKLSPMKIDLQSRV